jgi:phage RecT family recombinase
MNTKQQLAVIEDSIKTAARKFHYAVPKDSDINWGSEKVFAMDILRKSKDLRAALPETQVSAILQAGSMGLTLNPSAGECYLIPRRLKRNDPNSPIIAYASPSYRGLIKTAVDSGAILWAAAEVVHQNDRFEYFGKSKPAIHEVDVKRSRGEPIGVHVVAKLPSGGQMDFYMDKERILKARNMSDNPNGLMWTTFWQEGWCKTALRTAQKSFPRSDRLNRAMEILNEHEGFPELNKDEEQELCITVDQATVIRDLVKETKANEQAMLNWIGVGSIEDIPASKYGQIVEMLNKKKS